MRISDWSSDVCSSDLGIGDAITLTVHQRPRLREQLRILLGFAAAEGTAGEHGISLRAQCSSASTIAAPFNGNTYVTSLYVTGTDRSEEHTSELQSLMRISYAVFCLTKQHTTKASP